MNLKSSVLLALNFFKNPSLTSRRNSQATTTHSDRKSRLRALSHRCPAKKQAVQLTSNVAQVSSPLGFKNS